VRAEVELAMASAREQIISDGGAPTLGEVVRLAAQARPDLPEIALHRIAAEVLASHPGPTGDAAREVIHHQVARRLRIEPLVKKAMEVAFATVLEEFRAVTVQQSAVLESVGRQVHGVTGGQMREFAQRLREAVPSPLTEGRILEWADAHYENTGEWPKKGSGPIDAAPGETWTNVDAALRSGVRGLPGNSSLPQLLASARGVAYHLALPPLTTEQLLAWVDAHFARTGSWPSRDSGPVEDAPGETWAKINGALKAGLRGLPGRSSLPQLLAEHRGVPNRAARPPLTEEQIVKWADAHQRGTGDWPSAESGTVQEAPGESWAGINGALGRGLRGLPGGSSLAELLAQQRGRRNQKGQPPLSIEQILAWADAHHSRTGEWPKKGSGAIHEMPGESWSGINTFLIAGGRGLPGGSSLPRLLADERGVRNKQDLPELTVEKILVWADAHHERTGKWPKQGSGPIPESPEDTWKSVQMALMQGLRGLPGGSTLARLLAENRSVRHHLMRPTLTVAQILTWVDAHFERTGTWPNERSGSVVGGVGDTWKAIDRALQQGVRGLPGGSSLARLIREHRTVPSR
jgi:hypothetical protein